MTMARSDKESWDVVHNLATSNLGCVCLEKGFVVAISSDYLAVIRTNPKSLDRWRLCGGEPEKTSLERRQRMTGFPTRISLANMRKLIKRDSDTSVPTENFDRSLLIKTGLRSKAPTGGAALLDGIRFSNTAYHHVLSLSYWSICIPIANGQRRLGKKLHIEKDTII